MLTCERCLFSSWSIAVLYYTSGMSEDVKPAPDLWLITPPFTDILLSPHLFFNKLHFIWCCGEWQVEHGVIICTTHITTLHNTTLLHTHTHSHTVLLKDRSAVDDAQTRHRVVCAADGGHACVVVCRALWGVFDEQTAAATQLLLELLLEGLAQQVEGKRVEAGVGESQDTSCYTAHKVNQRGVHLAGGQTQDAKLSNVSVYYDTNKYK